MISVEEFVQPNSVVVGDKGAHLEKNSNILPEKTIANCSKAVQNQQDQCENLVGVNESVQTAVLNTKELAYNGAANTTANSILTTLTSFNTTEGAAMSETFEAQTVLPTSENNLVHVHAYINTPEKHPVNIKTLQSDGTQITEHAMVAQSQSLTQQDTGEQIVDTNASLPDQDALIQSSLGCQEKITQHEELPPHDLGDLPPWAAHLKGCERIGDSYRGYVHTEAELDMLLNMHKEHTHSAWGTRQSPSSQKPSVRFMWKSQYVPYDGVPFLNSGRRATVMECQYGPRRKGNKVKIEYGKDGQAVKRAHRPTCPARIYVKRVRKFPEYKIDKHLEGTPGLRLAQERALTALRVACLESRGEERFYVQFPLEIAHEYHYDDEEVEPHETLTILPTQVNLGSSRLDPRVVEKINELVARGVTDIYQVKHGVINFVEKDLFLGSDEDTPARHNKLFYPTVTDLQNHIHQAQLALESGTLESLPPPETLPCSLSKEERIRKRKRTEPRRVRASKSTPLRTICIRTDDPMDLAQDSSLQDTQGQVYVVVPSASNLFANSESLIGGPLDGDKATSMVQVLTVPASTSTAYLEQQTDGTLDLTGQFLALPVVNCENQESLIGKEPMPLMQSDMETSLSENQEPASQNKTGDEPLPAVTTMTKSPSTAAAPTPPSSTIVTSATNTCLTIPSIDIGNMHQSLEAVTTSSYPGERIVAGNVTVTTDNHRRTPSSNNEVNPQHTIETNLETAPCLNDLFSEISKTREDATQSTSDVNTSTQVYDTSVITLHCA